MTARFLHTRFTFRFRAIMEMAEEYFLFFVGFILSISWISFLFFMVIHSPVFITCLLRWDGELSFLEQICLLAGSPILFALFIFGGAFFFQFFIKKLLRFFFDRSD